jgi:hypothetical protein
MAAIWMPIMAFAAGGTLARHWRNRSACYPDNRNPSVLRDAAAWAFFFILYAVPGCFGYYSNDS